MIDNETASVLPLIDGKFIRKKEFDKEPPSTVTKEKVRFQLHQKKEVNTRINTCKAWKADKKEINFAVAVESFGGVSV